jgi:hypothetical protein
MKLLRPYAEQQNLEGTHVVIDGPGLAYHILHKCASYSNSLFSQPSPKLLGEATISWLDELQNRQVIVCV